MASFLLDLPQELLADVKRLERDSEKIFGGMTKAGADVALSHVKSNMPPSLQNSEFADHVFLSKQYKTPSDDGINTKVMVSGYFTNHNGVKTPAPLVANVFEYGSTKFDKQPFFRKSFVKSEIEEAMLKAQKTLSGGLLDE